MRRAIRRAFARGARAVFVLRLPRQARSCCKCSRCRQARPSSTASCCARAAARAGARTRDFPARPGRRRAGRAARRGAAPIRARRRSRHADRCGAARARGGKVGKRRAEPSLDVDRRRRGGAAVRRRLARSRGLGAGAAIRQRSARHADPDPPRAQARRPVAGGADRRRHADRIARGLRRRPKARSRAASRRASRRSPICASSARCCNAPASRCRWSIPTA